MLIDSHCHLSFPELVADQEGVFERMRSAGVGGALNVCVTLEEFPRVLALAESRADIWCSVGVHPDYLSDPPEGTSRREEPTVERLVMLAKHPRVVAIGETGLDYFRLKEPLDWQRERFRTHIRAARQAGKPLIVHTRSAAADTIRLMREEGADQCGGVMHCFTDTWETASAALDLGFYISFSGILTFKSAGAIREVAQRVPIDRLLVETDSPYLAPVPHRGKTNEPSLVPFVANTVSSLLQLDRAVVDDRTTKNFFNLFKAL